MLVEYVKDNYYARFHDPSYHLRRERDLSILLSDTLTKSMERENVCQGYRVMVHACRVCQGQLLCKV